MGLLEYNNVPNISILCHLLCRAQHFVISLQYFVTCLPELPTSTTSLHFKWSALLCEIHIFVKFSSHDQKQKTPLLHTAYNSAYAQFFLRHMNSNIMHPVEHTTFVPLSLFMSTAFRAYVTLSCSLYTSIIQSSLHLERGKPLVYQQR